MIDKRPDGLPPQPPTFAAPPPFDDRRVGFRRTEDRSARRETVLLARALDILASDITAEERLAGLLRLIAGTVRARRAAVVADGTERRAAVAIDPGEDPGAAEELAAWLDAHAPRSRAQRAAAVPAPISFIVGATSSAATDGTDAAAESAGRNRPPVPDASSESAPVRRHFALVPIPSAGGVALGFEFGRAVDADRVADRLPPTMARHAAVALALVTSQLASEREVAELRARESERATFISTVAHELRTPLTGLRGYLELILGGQVADPLVERDFLERSRTIVGSMGELVGDLLELSQLESGSIDLEIGPFSIAEACGQVAASLLSISIERGISLTTALPPRLRVASGDRRRVEQIVTNLTANALKFTPTGGRVEIEGRFDGLVAVVTVRDDGDGIPEEDRSRIFERFHRMTGHERITGTGLGLPIARDLARRMNGDLDVASVAGAGSAFVLVLPGPAAVEQSLVDSTLIRVVAAEEQGLEERAVRLAIAVAGRGLEGGPDGTEPPGPRRIPSGRLRALPSLRSEHPAPA
jgi:signal transduction histidine kinase